ncbi:MAG TPA: hypothetical protein DDW52_14030 [Planctomycetaceae bacterium]|nr:hypothetical protein [Planctomycetaceae bacterium]
MRCPTLQFPIRALRGVKLSLRVGSMLALCMFARGLSYGQTVADPDRLVQRPVVPAQKQTQTPFQTQVPQQPEATGFTFEGLPKIPDDRGIDFSFLSDETPNESRDNASVVQNNQPPHSAKSSGSLGSIPTDSEDHSGQNVAGKDAPTSGKQQAPEMRPQASLGDRAPVAGDTSDLWWFRAATQQIRHPSQPVTIDLNQLFVLTAAYSGKVQAVAQTPWVNRTLIAQAQGAFDPVLYTDARFDSISDPVENTLTTGGPPRLEDDIVGVDTGLRGQTRRGTSYNVGQRLGHKNSNSTFFVPNNQGSSRLFANLTQPLLRGRRIDVNRGLVLTAQFDTQAAEAAFRAALQKQLFQVADVFWSLYFERAALLQRIRHIEAAKSIVSRLEGRVVHDTTRNQILRARAAVASRTAEIANADAQIRNLESRMRALVNAPAFVQNRDAELIPNRVPTTAPLEFDLEQEVANALAARPEIAELTGKVGAAKARIRLASDMTKPQLDLIAEGYLAGLEGNSDVFGAWSDQFTEGRPGFATGLLYQRPVNNQTANATLQQRRLELNQLHHLLTEARENIRAEVEMAVRNTVAAGDGADARRKSLQSVQQEVAYLEDRWVTLGSDQRFGQIQLDELLRAQDRLLLEEQNLLRASVQFHRSLMELQRATGALISFQR